MENFGTPRQPNYVHPSTDYVRHLQERASRARTEERERIITVIAKTPHWTFTAPYGLEIGDDNKVIPRTRSEDEYVKVPDLLKAINE